MIKTLKDETVERQFQWERNGVSTIVSQVLPDVRENLSLYSYVIAGLKV